MERFLNEETVQSSRIRALRYTRLLCAAALLFLVFFIVLCLLTRTGNARVMFYLTMAESVLAGWTVILLWQFAVEPAQAEARHLTGLAAVEPEVRKGLLTMTGDAFRIPRSVWIRKVRLKTETETLSLNLNERLTDRMPPDGSLVCAETVRKFITGLEVLVAGPDRTGRRKPDRLKRFFRALSRFLLPGILWTMLALVFTGFVFNQITDTAPAHKIVIYADCEVRNAPMLADRLEKALNGAVRMVKIHPFSYAMFDSAGLKQADLFIIPDSRVNDYREWLGPEEGIPVFDPASGTAVCPDVFAYTPEPYRLYTGSSSVHLQDGLARRAAELMLTMTTE